jgi:peptidoglycan hydrolase-like protein with peptidoglycan-binding domain
MPSGPSAAAPRRARKRAVAGATLLVVVAIVVVAILVTSRGDHKKPGTHRAGAFAATVQRRNLVTSESETGTISYAGASTVTNRLQGTLTWTPGVGRVIQPGRKLFDVDNFPVILMNGTTPAYRTLDSSDTPGPDVQQLNENLIDLGFDVGGIVDEDEWQPATTDGVEAFQEANDEPETGSLTLGTVAFLRGAQRVAGLQGAASGVADDDPEANDAEFVGYTPPASAATATTPATTSTTATATTTTTSSTPQAPQAPAIARLNSKIQLLQRQTQVLQREVIQAKADARAGAEIPRLDSRVQELQRDNRQLEQRVVAARSHAPASGSSASAEPGPVSGGDSPVMTTTSTNLVVTVPVPAGQQGVTHIGARVPVVMPSGSTVRGRVTGIGQSSSGKVPITIHLEKHENGRNLDQATVNVKFVAKTARHVLSVPVTALLARPGGRYAVQRDRPPHRLIDVKLGTFATGFVEVSGKGLHPGLKITDSQG